MSVIENKLSRIQKCPFCGAKDIGVLRVVSIEYNWMHVHCQVCGARGPVGKTFDECVELWNKATCKEENG